MDWILIFLIGLFIGSFLNVCIYRIPREESIVFPGSHCPQCQSPVKAMDLVPVMNWLWLRGRCRHCQASISLRYPMVELFSAVLLVGIYMQAGLSVNFLFFVVLACLLMVISLIDLDHQMIPDGLTILVAAAGITRLLLGRLSGQGLTLGEAALGVLIGGGFFLLIAVLTGGGMGGGDIKLVAALGLWVGWTGMLVLMLLALTPSPKRPQLVSS